MCFTVNVNIVKEELERRYGSELLDHEKYRPSYYYHAYSFPELPVVSRQSSGENNLALFRWGLIPYWTGSGEEASKIRSMTLNARAESIGEKPSFSESFARRRCLLPVRGFYEWRHEGSKKIPYYIFHPSNPVLSLGAIFDRWNTPEGDRIYSFSIVTTRANKMMAEIHNTKKRMPVIIDPGEEDEWLYQGTPQSRLKEMMGSYPDDKLEAYTISPLIGNNRKNRNTGELIKPYDYPREQTLF